MVVHMMIISPVVLYQALVLAVNCMSAGGEERFLRAQGRGEGGDQGVCVCVHVLVCVALCCRYTCSTGTKVKITIP